MESGLQNIEMWVQHKDNEAEDNKDIEDKDVKEEVFEESGLLDCL